jgi:hypothetical protein
MLIQFDVPAPELMALKRSVLTRIQFDQWPPALQPSAPMRSPSTMPCAMRWSTPVMMSS